MAATKTAEGADYAGVKIIEETGDGTGAQHVIVDSFAAGDINLGNVDVLSVTPGTSASSLGKAEDAAAASADVGVAALAVRRDAAASSSGTDGDYSTINTDTLGNLRVAGALGADAGLSVVSSSAQEASKVIKASAGVLVSLTGYNAKVSAQFIQIYNSTTVPADTAVPIYSIAVAASSNFAFDLPAIGVPFATGIAVANSSTQATKTVGSADCWFVAVIR